MVLTYDTFLAASGHRHGIFIERSYHRNMTHLLQRSHYLSPTTLSFQKIKEGSLDQIAETTEM